MLDAKQVRLKWFSHTTLIKKCRFLEGFLRHYFQFMTDKRNPNRFFNFFPRYNQPKNEDHPKIILSFGEVTGKNPEEKSTGDRIYNFLSKNSEEKKPKTKNLSLKLTMQCFIFWLPHSSIYPGETRVENISKLSLVEFTGNSVSLPSIGDVTKFRNFNLILSVKIKCFCNCKTTFFQNSPLNNSGSDNQSLITY